MTINLHKVVLETFDLNNKVHLKLMRDLVQEKNSIYRLENIKKESNAPFNTSYVVLIKNTIIGCVNIKKIKQDEVQLEYAILQDENKKRYHEILLKEVTNFLSEFDKIKRFSINVDLSNLKKLRTTLECGYNPDYEDYENKHYPGKMILRRKNPNYRQEGEEHGRNK